MVDLKTRMTPAAEAISIRSPKLSQLTAMAGLFSPRPAGPAATSAYEQYLRLPELQKLWESKEFPEWKNGSVVQPALQALEITFRFISVVLSDPRPYANLAEWTRRLESLASHQIELIAAFCEEDEDPATAPTTDLERDPKGSLSRERSSTQEVWKLPGSSHTVVVNRTSEASLLPRLATWEKSEDVAAKIMFQIECQMRRSRFTLGLGEPNLRGKPNLEYDIVCHPAELHSLKKNPLILKMNNHENDTLYTANQILESWLFVAKQLLARIVNRIENDEWDKAASECWMLEHIWKLLVEIEDLHLLMDPDDFLRLKNQLALKTMPATTATTSTRSPFCFRSMALMEVMRASKDLKTQVPAILGVEVDPNGGPRIQEAAMRLFHSRRRGEEAGRIHLLQALQAVDAAVKKFFFSYRQLIVAVMGSLEAGGNFGPTTTPDPVMQIFSEPPYFPSLDAAKTFLGEYWQREQQQQQEKSASNIRFSQSRGMKNN